MKEMIGSKYRKITGEIFTVKAQHNKPIPPGWVLENDESGEKETVTNADLREGKVWEQIED